MWQIFHNLQSTARTVFCTPKDSIFLILGRAALELVLVPPICITLCILIIMLLSTYGTAKNKWYHIAKAAHLPGRSILATKYLFLFAFLLTGKDPEWISEPTLPIRQITAICAFIDIFFLLYPIMASLWPQKEFKLKYNPWKILNMVMLVYPMIYVSASSARESVAPWIFLHSIPGHYFLLAALYVIIVYIGCRMCEMISTQPRVGLTIVGTVVEKPDTLVVEPMGMHNLL